MRRAHSRRRAHPFPQTPQAPLRRRRGPWNRRVSWKPFHRPLWRPLRHAHDHRRSRRSPGRRRSRWRKPGARGRRPHRVGSRPRPRAGARPLPAAPDSAAGPLDLVCHVPPVLSALDVLRSLIDFAAIDHVWLPGSQGLRDAVIWPHDCHAAEAPQGAEDVEIRSGATGDAFTLSLWRIAEYSCVTHPFDEHNSSSPI